MLYLVYFTLSSFNILVCTYLVGKSFGRFGCLDFRSMFIDAFLWSVQLFSKTLLNLAQYHRTVRIFNNQHFALESKHKSLPVPSHLHNNVFFTSPNSVLLFLFLAAFFILKLNSCIRANNLHVLSFPIAVITT